MSKTTLALGSFIVGLTLGSYGNHTVTFAQSPTSSTAPRVVSAFNAGDFAPKVPGLASGNMSGNTISKGMQQIDGLDVSDWNFINATIVYGGGAVKLNRSSFTGTTRIVLTGAAANTAAFLAFVNARDSAPKHPITPNTPIERTANLDKPLVNVTWSTLYNN